MSSAHTSALQSEDYLSRSLFPPFICLSLSLSLCLFELPLLAPQFLFQQMGMVVCFVKIHIRPYMDDIFTLIRVSEPPCPSSVLSLCPQFFFAVCFSVLLNQLSLVPRSIDQLEQNYSALLWAARMKLYSPSHPQPTGSLPCTSLVDFC